MYVESKWKLYKYYELGNQNRILISNYLGRAKLFSVDRIVGSNKCLSWILTVAYLMVANLVKAIISGRS